MSDDDIDLDRVITDPKYRRQVIEFLNGAVEIDRLEKPRESVAVSATASAPEHY